MRLAWFTPWPPQSSGVAGRSAVLVPALAARGHGLDVFVDQADQRDQRDERDERAGRPASAADADPPGAGALRVHSAHDFVWRALRHQYDLVVYQLGNSRQHEFIWPYLFRWPGLAVFHDARIHHARGHALLTARRANAYRAEFAWNHPDVSRDAAELAVAGFDGSYYYLWPMVRAAVLASRAVAAHSRGGAREIQDACPERAVDYVALGYDAPLRRATGARVATRARYGWGPDAVVFGVFGALTPEKRIAPILGAFRGLRARQPSARLVLAGASDAALGWSALAAALGVADAVTFAPSLDDEAFDALIDAVDVTLNLRWPTALETSGPWVQALAAGRATVIIDLVHQGHVPALDPRTWQPWQPGDPADPVTIAIDVLDEEHSLGLAMRRLTEDAALRARLGRAAHEYWQREHSVERMVADYDAVLARAAALPLPAPTLPPSLRVQASEHLATLVAPFGDLSCELF